MPLLDLLNLTDSLTLSTQLPILSTSSASISTSLTSSSISSLLSPSLSSSSPSPSSSLFNDSTLIVFDTNLDKDSIAGSWWPSNDSTDGLLPPLLLPTSPLSPSSTLDTSRSLLFTLLTSITLGALILSTIIGNLFVIVAIWIDRNLQNIQNYLVASLAAADFMVACLVMPLGAVYEVQGEWSLGSLLCDIWTSVDVLCCTASILHLVAIALDRYWAVNSVTYMHSRSPTKICSIIVSVWSVALIVSIGPILGWKDPDYERRVTVEKRCLISQHMGYQIFATVSTFYGPLLVILFLYWRIYKIARRRVKNRPGNKSIVHVKADEGLRSTSNGKPLALVETEYQKVTGNMGSQQAHITIEESKTSRSDNNDEASPLAQKKSVERDSSDSSSAANPTAQVSCDEATLNSKKGQTVLGLDKALRLRNKKDQTNSKREGKTAKILAIITGIFIVCWLPFFVHALVTALCGERCEAPAPVYSILLWLGYANSLLNPVIYTIFSRDFRNAFRRILFGANPGRP